MSDISAMVTIYDSRDLAGKNWRMHEYITVENEQELEQVVDRVQQFQSSHGFTPIFCRNRTRLISMQYVLAQQAKEATP